MAWTGTNSWNRLNEAWSIGFLGPCFSSSVLRIKIDQLFCYFRFPNSQFIVGHAVDNGKSKGFRCFNAFFNQLSGISVTKPQAQSSRMKGRVIGGHHPANSHTNDRQAESIVKIAAKRLSKCLTHTVVAIWSLVFVV